MNVEVIAESSNIENNTWNINLEYEDKNNCTSFFTSEGNLHPYPAKAVPDMVHDILKKLIDIYGTRTVLDPFVGSGTVALESKALGLDFYGSDLNPLAVLLAKTKSLTVKNTGYIKKTINDFICGLSTEESKNSICSLPSFNNIEYWFKTSNIKQLAYLKRAICLFLDKRRTKQKEVFSLIILTAFSATVRQSSLTRNEEFKLYRLSPADIKNFDVDSVDVFKERINEILNMLREVNNKCKENTICEIYLENAKNLTYLKDKKVGIVLTSPPYGDSQSTVAYGQFSRLSIQWMSDLMKKYLSIAVEYDNCDEYLLGGDHSILQLNNDEKVQIVNYSSTLRTLFADIKLRVQRELNEYTQVRQSLISIKEKLNKDNEISVEILEGEGTISRLLRERIRLYKYRQINKSTELTKEQVKQKTKQELDGFIENLKNSESETKKNNIETLKTFVMQVIETVDRKIEYLPKREKEICDFFIDLYQVVKETNRVIAEKGIQVWIVGHRTVLGSIDIKLADILNEWFLNHGYEKIAIISRKYHYKRLPHHINCTVTRDKKVKTMNQEHVLIVQKK